MGKSWSCLSSRPWTPLPCGPFYGAISLPAAQLLRDRGWGRALLPNKGQGQFYALSGFQETAPDLGPVIKWLLDNGLVIQSTGKYSFFLAKRNEGAWGCGNRRSLEPYGLGLGFESRLSTCQQWDSTGSFISFLIEHVFLEASVLSSLSSLMFLLLTTNPHHTDIIAGRLCNLTSGSLYFLLYKMRVRLPILDRDCGDQKVTYLKGNANAYLGPQDPTRLLSLVCQPPEGRDFVWSLMHPRTKKSAWQMLNNVNGFWLKDLLLSTSFWFHFEPYSFNTSCIPSHLLCSANIPSSNQAWGALIYYSPGWECSSHPSRYG